jgi:glycerol-3-phosphate acyltransferase PlsX
MLKSWESLVGFFTDVLREELKSNPMRATGALLSRGAFRAVRERINPDRYGGAPLLGLRGNVLKAHGSSNRHAIKSALRACHAVIAADLNRLAGADVARANDLISQPVVA